MLLHELGSALTLLADVPAARRCGPQPEPERAEGERADEQRASATSIRRTYTSWSYMPTRRSGADDGERRGTTCSSGTSVAGSPGATKCVAVAERARRAAASERSPPRSRGPSRDARSPTRSRARPRDSRRAACAARARARARSSPSPRASATIRAASGTPGGSTPSTRCVRSANSGVSAETIEITPASVAAHARATGVAGRRTGHTVAAAVRSQRSG